MKKKKPADRHLSPRVAFHLPDGMHRELLRFVQAVKPKTTISDVVRLAVEEFLARQRK